MEPCQGANTEPASASKSADYSAVLDSEGNYPHRIGFALLARLGFFREVSWTRQVSSFRVMGRQGSSFMDLSILECRLFSTSPSQTCCPRNGRRTANFGGASGQATD